MDVCQPKAGETVVISGAAGAVGSHVGQIAKILGLTVIGIAGSDEKCKWIVDELGFDHAINYKTEDVATSLKKAAPNGVNCYFDNVKKNFFFFNLLLAKFLVKRVFESDSNFIIVCALKYQNLLL